MILKYQQGGGVGAFPTYTITNPISVDPFSTTEASTTKSGKKADTDDGLDVMKMVYDAGLLPNDTAYIAQFANKIMRLADTPGFKGIGNLYAQFQYELSKAKYHKEEREKAVTQAEKTGAMPEVAITSDGKLVGQDEDGKMQFITVDQARSGKFRVIRNSELKDMNAFDPTMVFDTKLLAIIENGIGMSEVNKLIKEASMSLGTTDIQKEGYTLKMAQDVQAGLRIAAENQEGMPLAGLYKSGTISKEQADQVLLALDYIYNALPTNAKTLLHYKTGSENASKELIFKRLGAQLSSTQHFKTNYELDLEGNKPGAKEKTEKEQNFELTPAMALALGRGSQKQIRINVGNSNEIVVNGRYSVLNNGAENLGAGKTFVDLTNSDYAGVLDLDNASFGGTRLHTDLGHKVLLRNADVYSMELPIDVVAAAKGLIKPDLFLTKRLEEAENYIRLHKITEPEQINKVYDDHDLPPKFDSNGEFNIKNYAKFARITAVVEETALGEDPSLDSSVLEIEDDYRRNEIETTLKLKDKDYKMGSGFWGTGLGLDRVYEGAIYIPIRPDAINASLGAGKYLKVYGTDDTEVIRDNTQTSLKLDSYQKPTNLAAMK